jgi:hypothetical protein
MKRILRGTRLGYDTRSADAAATNAGSTEPTRQAALRRYALAHTSQSMPAHYRVSGRGASWPWCSARRRLSSVIIA